MAGVFRAFLFVGAAARLSLLVEMHTRAVPNARTLLADLRSKVANVSGLNSTDVAVDTVLPEHFFFPCPEILPSYEPDVATAIAKARQLHDVHGPHGHGPHGPHGPGGLHFFARPWDGPSPDARDDGEYDYDDYDEESMLEHGPHHEMCAKCLAAGKDYCVEDNRCTPRATRTCNGPEDHVTGSPEFARTSPGHSMKCPKPDEPVERGFLHHHGRQGFPVLLEVHGVTGDKLIHDLRAHAAALSATACETAEKPCKVTFEL